MTARVLVVDDILANVKLLEARLSAEYFEVLTASNGPDDQYARSHPATSTLHLTATVPRRRHAGPMNCRTVPRNIGTEIGFEI